MKKAYLSVMTMFAGMILWAQEKTTDIDVDLNAGEETSNWYASPWVWVIGAAVFIILLVALTSGGSRRSSGSSDKVTVTKTVKKDTDN